ncbi:MDR family oxidoreductase [Herbiconiux ginsengi]|uniref:Putative quinone oxidoreductase, YhdH/YhfP family n=1 Tax=Herbiconiux ginsengi TaxID=381665 RepID=A0A1H3TE74_9MICO|nr:MDR family oxidoreductase [Herbiconiux ginsengi]SDZ47659.1 putative quinone oxidoreductase, YhdH/YhfP family [Herbiconiux ginsengi]
MRAIISRNKNLPAELTQVDEHDLGGGDVLIDVTHSSLNYKDGMALTGRGIVRRWPLILGIDVTGVVAESSSPRFSPGDRVTLNGSGLGELRNGGYAQRARVSSEFLIYVPEAISLSQAAAIGTAGFTAAIAVLALEREGVEPGDGEILVTGAAGGVGSIAISLLARRGYAVVASSGRAVDQGEFLRSLGAHDVIDRTDLAAPGGPPVQPERWSGAIDSIGSHTLANVLAQSRYEGVVVANGMAQGIDLPTSVLPFILRAVTLVGANSVDASLELRRRAWTVLADELDLDVLDRLTTTIGLEEVIGHGGAILHGAVRGRTVVNVV